MLNPEEEEEEEENDELVSAGPLPSARIARAPTSSRATAIAP
jgi:hypothetical protein